MPSKKDKTPVLADRYYHIFNRGNNYEKTFFTSMDYLFFYYLLEKYLLHCCDIYALALIPNHYHLLVKTKGVANELSFSECIRRLIISYTYRINQQKCRNGSLFLKTFKRIEIKDTKYLMRLIFYIHNNPYKHGLTDDFKEYKYSSYQSIIGNNFTIINRDSVIELYGSKDGFISYHNYLQNEKKIERLIIED